MAIESKNTNTDEDDYKSRPIKRVSANQIEQAFAKALLELTGQKYKVDLKRFDLNSDPNAWFKDTALLDFKIEKDVDSDSTDPFTNS